MKIPNLALDIDGVLANFSEAVVDRAYAMGMGESFPSGWREVRMWDISPRFQEVMHGVWKDPDFWLSVKPLPNTSRELEPAIYLTSRPIDGLVSSKWLRRNGFPSAEVVTVAKPEDKVAVLKERGLFLIDDHYQTVEACIKQEVKAYLFKAPYQRGYDVSHLPSVSSLEEVMQKHEGENKVLAWRN